MTKKAWVFKNEVERSGPKKSKQPKRRHDFPVDTSLPMTSATDRRVDIGLSAERHHPGNKAIKAPPVKVQPAGRRTS